MSDLKCEGCSKTWKTWEGYARCMRGHGLDEKPMPCMDCGSFEEEHREGCPVAALKDVKPMQLPSWDELREGRA